MPENTTLVQRRTALSANIVAFCRYLRQKGLRVSTLEESEVLKALASIPFNDPDTFRLILRQVITKSVFQQKIFDKHYSAFWKELEKGVDSKIKNQDRTGAGTNREKAPSLQSLKDWLYGKPVQEEAQIATYSPAEVLISQDFSKFRPDEIDEIKRWIRIFARRLSRIKSRRFKLNRHKGSIDLRNTMRRNLNRGGEVLDLYYRKRKYKPVKWVVFCDASKSMSLYSNFLIQFLYSFQFETRQMESFIFSTGFLRITEYLRGGTFTEAMAELSGNIAEWSGGTNIGGSLSKFLDDYIDILLTRDTVFIILSDGWDTGETKHLKESMAVIKSRCKQVIWLNPLAGNPGFKPAVKGMRTALPYIDIFAPFYNIESMQKLANLLARGN